MQLNILHNQANSKLQ